VVFWTGDTQSIRDGLTLLTISVHFAGGRCRWAGGADGAALLSGDIHLGSLRTGAGRFMPFPPPVPERGAIQRSRCSSPYPFEVVYGAWWRRVVHADGAAAVRRSADRYLRFALDDR
jgi:hypothetical protein